MKKTIKLSIAEPCHEDWAIMTATQKGRHCQSCNKEVVDFTDNTDEEIVTHVLKNKNACGRFIVSQLERELTLERKSGHRLAPLAASFLLPFTLLASSFSNASTTNVSSSEFTSLTIGSLHKNTKQITVKGVVRGIDGNPIEGAIVTVKETGKTTTTVRSGEYSINLLSSQTLVYSHLNFKSVEVVIGTTSVRKDIKLQNPEPIETNKPFVLKKIASQLETSVIKKDTLTATVEVKGTVIDNSELPLPGVQILIKGTTSGTQTDFDGNYALLVKPGQTLIFSSLGFETKEIAVSTISKKIKVILNEEKMRIMGGIGVKGVQIKQSKSALSKTKGVYSRLSEFFQ